MDDIETLQAKFQRQQLEAHAVLDQLKQGLQVPTSNQGQLSTSAPPVLGVEALVKMETNSSPLLNPTEYHLQERRRMQYAQAPSPGTSANLTVSPRSDAGSSPSSPAMSGRHSASRSPAPMTEMPQSSSLMQLEQQLLAAAGPANFPLAVGGRSPLATRSLAGDQAVNPMTGDTSMDAILAGIIGLDTGTGAGMLPLNDDLNVLAVEPAVRGPSPLASSSCPNIRDMHTLASNAFSLEQRERQRKDTHNMTEKKRRYQVNDSIQEIADLIPGTEIGARRSKGAILKAAARHLRRLQKVDARYREERRKARKYGNALNIMKQRIHEYDAVVRAHNLAVPTQTEETTLLARLDLPRVSLEQCITLLDCLDVQSEPGSDVESVSSFTDEFPSEDDMDEELLGPRRMSQGSAASAHSSRSNSMTREFS